MKKEPEFSDMKPGEAFIFKLPKVGSTDWAAEMCCECKLVHHWHVTKEKGGIITVKVYRDDEATDKARGRKKH